MIHRLSAVAFAVLLLTACAGPAPTMTPVPTPSPSGNAAGYPGWPPNASSDILPVLVSSEVVVGTDDRVLFNLIDQNNGSLVSADRGVSFRFYDLAADPTTPATTAPGTYLEILGPSIALYRTNVGFDSAGDWGVEAVTAEPDGSQRTGRAVFTVAQTGTTPQIGAAAPSTDTPSATDAAGVAQISTDTSPDPDFYRTSVAQALAAHQPFLLIFATPAFCSSRTCGPALDIVKSVAEPYKAKVDFIHVEPYQLQQVNGAPQLVLSADNLPIPIDAVLTYGLPTEPYIFVVDSAGRITAKFEGVASADEITQALDGVANGG